MRPQKEVLLHRQNASAFPVLMSEIEGKAIMSCNFTIKTGKADAPCFGCEIEGKVIMSCLDG